MNHLRKNWNIWYWIWVVLLPKSQQIFCQTNLTLTFSQEQKGFCVLFVFKNISKVMVINLFTSGVNSPFWVMLTFQVFLLCLINYLMNRYWPASWAVMPPSTLLSSFKVYINLVIWTQIRTNCFNNYITPQSQTPHCSVTIFALDHCQHPRTLLRLQVFFYLKREEEIINTMLS